jgi:hypothetical protein
MLRVTLKPREETCAGTTWYAFTIVWEGRPQYGTGMYRNPADARAEAQRILDTIRATAI